MWIHLVDFDDLFKHGYEGGVVGAPVSASRTLRSEDEEWNLTGMRDVARQPVAQHKREIAAAFTTAVEKKDEWPHMVRIGLVAIGEQNQRRKWTCLDA